MTMTMTECRMHAKTLRNLALIAFALHSAGATAACTRLPGVNVTNINLNVGTVTIPNNTEVGQTFFTRTVDTVPPAGHISWCTGPGRWDYASLYGTPVPGYTNVYSTDLTGIGYRLRYNFGGSGHSGYYLPYSTNYNNTYVVLGNPQTFILELVKTGPLTQGGQLGNGPIMSVTTDRGDRIMYATISTSLSRVILPPCSIRNNGRIDVPMGRWRSNDFRGVNSEIGARNFDIILDCQNRNPDVLTSYITISGTRETDSSASGILRLTNKGSPGVAGGIGIKLVRNTGPVTGPVELGREAEIGRDLQGPRTLSYTASYVQVGNNVTPGRADSTATLTLTYR